MYNSTLIEPLGMSYITIPINTILILILFCILIGGGLSYSAYHLGQRKSNKAGYLELHRPILNHDFSFGEKPSLDIRFNAYRDLISLVIASQTIGSSNRIDALSEAVSSVMLSGTSEVTEVLDHILDKYSGHHWSKEMLSDINAELIPIMRNELQSEKAGKSNFKETIISPSTQNLIASVNPIPSAMIQREYNERSFK